MAAPPIWVEYVNTIPPSRTIVRDVLTAPIETITLGGKGSVGVPTARERTDAKSSVSIELIVSPAIPSIFWYGRTYNQLNGDRAFSIRPFSGRRYSNRSFPSKRYCFDWSRKYISYYSSGWRNGIHVLNPDRRSCHKQSNSHRLRTYISAGRGV